MAWRFLETDFKLKTHYGELPDSSLEDWPITYDDLEPYYYQAEREVGVAGSNEGNPFAAPRKQPVFHLEVQCKIVQQRAVPIPKNRVVSFHSLSLEFLSKTCYDKMYKNLNRG